MPNLAKPLSEILRPNKLQDFADQEHLVGENGPIKKLLQNHTINSMIFWGPPGCGKTTLARLIANELNANFVEISPTTAGVKDIKETVENAKQRFFGQKDTTILFVDEIHRFNKAQQDYLLPHVENGTIILIGATTENPSFEVVSPLLSRTRVYKFNPITKENIKKLIDRALKYLNENGQKLKISQGGIEFLTDMSNGDARNVLNALESIILTGHTKIDTEIIKKILQENPNRYDKKGDEHYDTISAFIKSMRASNVDAALYYLAKMVDAGENPKFIARRMVIFASEDIGMANSNALIVANEVFRACETIGYPECQLNLAHGTIYLAASKKSREVNDSFLAALDDINLSIPLHIRNAPTKLMKDMGYGKNYEKHPKNSGVKDGKNTYLPKELQNKKYFKSYLLKNKIEAIETKNNTTGK